MINELKNNIRVEIEIVRELYRFSEQAKSGNPEERRIYSEMVSSLRKRIKLVNNSLPEIIKEISLTKKLVPEKKIEDNKSEVSFGRKPSKVESPTIVLAGKDKEKYLRELNITESLIKKIARTEKKSGKGKKKYKKASKFGKYSNKYFLETSNKLIKKGYFDNISFDLRKSNLNILTSTYVSMMLFGMVLSFFASLLLAIFFLFFSVGANAPFVTLYDGNYILRFTKVFWLILAIPIFTGFMFYLYPGAEKKSLGSRINQELPFAVIHMASISGSGIQPIEIFKIIGAGEEYKYLGPEIKKILNQTNIYGYDLTTALRNIALSTPSKKLSELLGGIGVTIRSGGDIKKFFEKRGESLLLEYRLEREKYTKATETFMDLYISIVIAAPMVLLMLLIMISVSGISIGFSVKDLSIAIVGVVAIINLLFLSFLHFKQPGY